MFPSICRVIQRFCTFYSLKTLKFFTIFLVVFFLSMKETEIHQFAIIVCWNVGTEKIYINFEDLKQYIESCNCLPTCTSITYTAEISQAEFEKKSFSENTSSNEILA